MKYLVLNDPHLDIYAPSSRRTDDYMATCVRKLQQISDISETEGVEYLVCTGDWFHKKNPQGVPHRLVGELVRWASDLTANRGTKILTVLGNHDVQFNDMSWESVKKQPVSLLLEVPFVYRVSDAPIVDLQNGVIFVGQDFLSDCVQADGSTYVDPSQFVVPPMLDTNGMTVVQVTHASVLPTTQMWTHMLASELPKLSTADICHTGHIHEDLGIHRFVREDGSVFHWTNIGSMTRGSLTEETIAREPKVLLVDLEPGKPPVFKQIVLEHEPAENIYDVEAYRETKAQTKAFTAWTEQLQRELHATTSQTTSLQEIVNQSTLDLPARDLALRLLNDAGA